MAGDDTIPNGAWNGRGGWGWGWGGGGGGIVLPRLKFYLD